MEVTDRIYSAAVSGDSLEFWTVRGEFGKVPLSTIRPNAVLAPDFTDVRVIDYGHAVAFGEYEAAADAILEDCINGA